MKVHLKISSSKWLSIHPGLNMLSVSTGRSIDCALQQGDLCTRLPPPPTRGYEVWGRKILCDTLRQMCDCDLLGILDISHWLQIRQIHSSIMKHVLIEHWTQVSYTLSIHSIAEKEVNQLLPGYCPWLTKFYLNAWVTALNHSGIGPSPYTSRCTLQLVKLNGSNIAWCVCNQV